MSSQGRDKILKEGYVKFKQSFMPLQRWKQRYLVFKLTQAAGRLQLIVYKEPPATAVNEIKEISIDQFGGLENNLRLDGEKFVFAIITTTITECFSVETPQELSDWSQLLQEYLGKELLIAIQIPTKQPLLRVGKAILRIRNTGFTITTCENPPRCQGTWQIIHIRKYGGSDIFRFQTGSKCPTGENLYYFETKDNAGLKKLFSDLSNHKPIFADDRLGRRMTLEKTFNSKVSSQSDSPLRSGPNRRSFQVSVSERSPHQPVYENREPLQALPEYTNVTELSVPLNSGRRRSFDDVFSSNNTNGETNPLAQVMSSRKASQDGAYQNMPKPGLSSVQEVLSPTKKAHCTISVPVPVPDGYYNFPPPSLLTKSTSKNRFPSNSPEDEGVSIQEIQASLSPTTAMVPHPSTTVHTDRYSPEVAMDAVGDKTSQRSKQLTSNFDIHSDGTYQNLQFMRGPMGDTPRKYAPESLTQVATREEEWIPHEYTNVQLAQANIQGHSSRTMASNSRRPKLSEVTSLTFDGKPGSAAKRSKKRELSPLHSLPFHSLPQSSSIDTLLDSQPVTKYKSKLRSSLSDHEIASSASKRNGRPNEYYNFCAPNLPAHIKNRDANTSLQNKFTISTLRSPHLSDTPSDHDSLELLSPDVGPATGADYSKMIPVTRNENLSHNQDDSVVGEKSVDGAQGLSSSCDCLVTGDMISVASLSEKRPDSQNALYDKLQPQRTSNKQSMYDSLEPYKDNPKSGSSSPDANSSLTFSALSKWNQRSDYFRHIHNYEDIDGTEEDKQHGSRSGSHSPTKMELPSEWTSPLNEELDQSRPTREKSHHISWQVPNTQSRKKHLPLQDIQHVSLKSEHVRHNSEFARHDSEHVLKESVRTKPNPPKLSRGLSVDVSEINTYKYLPLTDKRGLQSQPRVSVDSLDSVDFSRNRMVSSGSHSSLELNSDGSHPHEKTDTNNSSIRISYEPVALKPSLKGINQSEQSSHHNSDPPPIPYRSSLSSKAHVKEQVNMNLPSRRDCNSSTSKPQSIHKATDSSPLLPPRSHHDSSKISVPLPQAQFTFKPQPPPKPRVLLNGGGGIDPYYTPVSFLDGTKSLLRAPQRDTSVRAPRSKVPVDYASVDFELTKGLQKTSEQVALDHREYFEGIEHTH